MTNHNFFLVSVVTGVFEVHFSSLRMLIFYATPNPSPFKYDKTELQFFFMEKKFILEKFDTFSGIATKSSCLWDLKYGLRVTSIEIISYIIFQIYKFFNNT